MLSGMTRALIAGLCALCSVACADGGSAGPPRLQELSAEVDAGPGSEPCGWFVYWLTVVDIETECSWGMVSRDPAVALFRTNGGECLAPTTICGIPACSDLTYVREKQIVEVWGPAGLDAGTVWAATETYDCAAE